jgi:hypothetical protein
MFKHAAASVNDVAALNVIRNFGGAGSHPLENAHRRN